MYACWLAICSFEEGRSRNGFYGYAAKRIAWAVIDEIESLSEKRNLFSKNRKRAALGRFLYPFKISTLEFEIREEISSDPAERMEINEEAQYCLSLIHNDTDRQCVILHYFHGKKKHEIAKHFGLAPSNISQRIKRAIKDIRRRLGEDECLSESLPNGNLKCRSRKREPSLTASGVRRRKESAKVVL